MSAAASRAAWEELNIFSTIIRTSEGIKKIVPNNTIWNGVIVNRTTGVCAARRLRVQPPPPEPSSGAKCAP